MRMDEAARSAFANAVAQARRSDRLQPAYSVEKLNSAPERPG
jgi:hypothetical protein